MNDPMSPHVVRDQLLLRLTPVAVEEVPLEQAAGRVLAEPVVADRDSPPHDVSAMDGYAVKLADLSVLELPVAGEVAMGAVPPQWVEGTALRITTGACVPEAADAIVMREDGVERDGRIRLEAPLESMRRGQHIRRRGENLRAGAEVLGAGYLVRSPVAGALATFGMARVRVHRRVRVALVVTGNEILPPSASPTPWQIRDANGPALEALLDGLPWVKRVPTTHAADDRATIESAIRQGFEVADLVLVTGGVSAGVHDYVPEATRRAGGEVLFHRLPIRPGKPLLGAMGPNGQGLLGLPGNPVSVLIVARWFGVAALRRLAGLGPEPEAEQVEVLGEEGKRIKLWWFRPVRRSSAGRATLVPNRGSGDIVAASRSDGFVLLPPQAGGPGPWPFTRWHDDQ